MNLRGIMKSLSFFSIAAFFVLMANASAWGQTVIVNYDFGTTNGCTATGANAANITSAFSVASGTCTSATGTTATSPPAFVASTTAGQAPGLSGTLTPAFQFTLGGSSLSSYSDYSLFFQLRSSGTGPNTATVEYSVNGGAFMTAPGSPFAVPTTSTFTAFNIDLSSVTALDNATSIIFRITGSGGTATTGTFRIDNFQVQATAAPTATAPTITSANNTTFIVGQPGTFTVTTTGTPTPTLSVSGALPSGVTFTDNGDGTATIAGTPAAGTNGSYALTITASNGAAPDAVQNFTLTVNAAAGTCDTTVVVTSANPNGFSFFQEVANGSGAFVNGPGTPPLGMGSAFLQVDSTGREILFTQQFAGTRFADITTLQYSSFQANANNPDAASAAISLQFDVDYNLSDANTAFQGRIVYEPANNGPVLQETWQTFNTLTGVFYATGAIGIAAGCGQSTPCTRAQLLALFPNLGIRFVSTGAPNNGTLLLKAGGPVPGGFTGYTDALVIGINGCNTTFNFEPLAPTAAPANIGGRVTANGRGISKVRVILSGGDLEQPLYAITSSFGYYRFENLSVGETYIIEVKSKRYTFANPTLVVNLQENLSETNFLGELIQNGAK